MKIKLNYILSAIAAMLLALCVASVYAPIRFDKMKAERETAVKERLVAIRKAQEAYRKANGRYAAKFSQLVDSRLIADSMQTVPFSGGEKFTMTATIHTGKSGIPTPLVECGAEYGTYLKGMDGNRIEELTERAYERGAYPGLKFGDITTPNDNAGNWE